MSTLQDPMPAPLGPVPRAGAPRRERTPRLRVAGAIGTLLAVPPTAFGLLQLADPDADRGAREAFEQGLMVASVLFMLVMHAWALVLLVRESRERRRGDAARR